MIESMKTKDGYETVIGLEVHAELNTATKIFCSCPNVFGAEPNTLCCPVCAGLPGAVPRLNQSAVKKAITAGLALHCEIAQECRMDRKQYFYPDLPKAYQISQNEYPICRNGYLDIETDQGKKRIGITRIHMEEDAGKLIHADHGTQVDCNRCGVGLIEIVSEPDLRSAEEAVAYLRALRAILRACNISDCKMQEGSFRCDVNLSIRPLGCKGMGERTEIKNLNSFSFVEKAIHAEIERQKRELEGEGRVLKQTVRFLPDCSKTEPMRLKESASDYRFFPEPNLPPIRVSEQEIETLRDSLPELPEDKKNRLCRTYGISLADAAVLVSDEELAKYFEETATQSTFPKQMCNLLVNEILRFCQTEPFTCAIPPHRLGELSDMLGEMQITRAVAKDLLLRLLKEDFSPFEVAKLEGLTQISDETVIRNWATEVLSENPKSVSDYRGGKSNALRALQGKLMAKSRGRANPMIAEKLLLQMIGEVERDGEENV